MSCNTDLEAYTAICRLCMQRDGFMIGIFNHIQGKERSIYKKIMDCTTLEVNTADGLPNCICHRCLYKVDFFLEFREQCQLSDLALRQMKILPKELHKSIEPIICDNSVVMVVDPNALDYDSECESNTPGKTNILVVPDPVGVVSDVDAPDTNDAFEFKNVHMCKFCDKAFSSKTECMKHETEDHDKENPYKCSVCLQSFADRNRYTSHLKSEHQNDKAYTCPECDRSFARRSDLRKHTIVHTGIKPFTCHICYKSFSRNTNLSKHIRIHKGQKPFVCHSCPRTFMSKIALNRHEIQHTGVKPYKCNYCQMAFVRKDKMLRHRKRHLPKETTEETFQELQALRENLMNEYGMTNFNNQISEGLTTNQGNQLPLIEEKDSKEDWTSTENLVINIDPFNNGHDEDIEVEPLCITPDILNSQAELENESESSPEKSDSREQISSSLEGNENNIILEDDFEDGTPKKYPCTLCPISFATIDRLNQHMTLHNGERPFGCNVCGRAFMKKRELDRHYITHTGVKQFECDKCKKRFSRKDKLLRHSRIHEANTEECEICKMTFNRKDGLVQHMKNHFKEESFGGIYNQPV